MQAWKPLVVIVSAGLILGMVSGELTRPVMAQRVTDKPWPSMLQARSDRKGQSPDYPDQQQDGQGYVGGYSFAPVVRATNARWTPPHEDRWAYADAPLPTVAQLDARQAALLANPEVEFAVHRPAKQSEPPSETAAEPQDGEGQSPPSFTPEPSTPDGQLPAVW
ncbi:MAG TPA: hypothetical protein VLM18_11445 [Croceibacterium sp.]|nr:hypothetical protein [Croceibacterium sp.]